MTEQNNAAVIANWVRKHSAVGAKCGNCGIPFKAVRTAKGIVGIPNGAGYSIYVLCRPCARRFKRRGPAGIPHAVKDAMLATLLWFAPTRGTA
jgi:hypothetical protein